MWLACLVFGVSAGLLLTYHLLLSSRAAPLPTAKAATSFARANSSSMQSIHRDALQDAATARRAS